MQIHRPHPNLLIIFRGRALQSGFNKPSGWFWCPLKLGSPCKADQTNKKQEWRASAPTSPGNNNQKGESNPKDTLSWVNKWQKGVGLQQWLSRPNFVHLQNQVISGSGRVLSWRKELCPQNQDLYFGKHGDSPGMGLRMEQEPRSPAHSHPCIIKSLCEQALFFQSR